MEIRSEREAILFAGKTGWRQVLVRHAVTIPFR